MKITFQDKQNKSERTLADLNPGEAFILQETLNDFRAGEDFVDNFFPVFINLGKPIGKGRYKAIQCVSLHEEALCNLVPDAEVVRVQLEIIVTLQ